MLVEIICDKFDSKVQDMIRIIEHTKKELVDSNEEQSLHMQ
jgi:hypothetical protein